MCKTVDRRETLKRMKKCKHQFVMTKMRVVGHEMTGSFDMPVYTPINHLSDPVCCLCGVTPERLEKWGRRVAR